MEDFFHQYYPHLPPISIGTFTACNPWFSGDNHQPRFPWNSLGIPFQTATFSGGPIGTRVFGPQRIWPDISWTWMFFLDLGVISLIQSPPCNGGKPPLFVWFVSACEKCAAKLLLDSSFSTKRQPFTRSETKLKPARGVSCNDWVNPPPLRYPRSEIRVLYMPY